MPRDPDGRTVLTDPDKLNSCNRPVVWARWASGAFHTGYQRDRGAQPPAAQGIKTKGSFPNEDAARKLVYLALQNAVPQWTRCRNWTTALLAFKIHFGNRVPDTAN